MTTRMRLADHPRLHHLLDELFGVDLRTLALLRVGLAAVLLVVLGHAFLGAATFYSDWGVMPRERLVHLLDPLRFTLLAGNGTPLFARLFIALQWLLALMLLVGWRTRIVTVLSWLLLASLQNRDPLVLTGGDSLLLLLLFWGMFLPLSARYSVDAALAPETPAEPRQLSWASAGLLIQVLSVYFFGALLEHGAEWWPDGTAVHYALSLDRYATGLGQYLLHFPRLLQALTYCVYFLELIGPWLAFSPLLTRPFRLVVMALLMTMNIGFILCLHLGHFPYVSLVSLTALAGGWLWDAAERRLRPGRGVGVYYDRDCGFCLKSCLLLRTFLAIPHAQILPAQDHRRANTLMQANTSWVVIDSQDRAHLKWAALVALLRASPLFGWWLAPLLRPAFWARPGDWVYRLIGSQRNRPSRATAGLPPARQPRFSVPPAADRVAGLALLAITCWNLTTVHALPVPVKRALAPLLQPFRLDQRWSMFGPEPWRDDGWYVVPGRLENGDEVDVLRPDQPLRYDEASHLDQLRRLPIRWRTYQTRLWSREHAASRRYWARYLCRHWNLDAKPGRRLLSLRIVYVLKQVPPIGQSGGIERHVLWTQDCTAKADHGTP